jgi:hypothetical protein
MWAYRAGKLDSVMGRVPGSIQQTFQSAGERMTEVVNSEQARRVASTVQERVQGSSASRSEIAAPSASEIATRPSGPLPGKES